MHSTLVNAIEVSHLRRTFKSNIGVIKRTTREIVAVDDISFEIQEGELFGLLGPNGAGKTTTVKMLTTLLIPTSGAASVKGFDVVAQAEEVGRRIGFIFGGERGLYWRLSGVDNLRYFASLYIIITTISTCGLGLLMGCLSLITVNVMFVNNFVYFLLLIFSGANVRLDQVPAWVQATSSLLPLTRGISAARLLVQGANFTDVMPLLLGELGVGLIYALLGYLLFAVFEVEAKKRGTLEVF